MSDKQFLKMADVFVHDGVEALEQHIYAGYMSKHCCEYAAHAINSHDELVRQRDELLAAMKTIANSEEFHGDSFICNFDSLQSVARASITKTKGCALNHFPDAGKMVPDGCHALMTLDEAIAHAYEKSIGDSQCAAQHAQLAKWLDDYRAMLASAPKLGGE